MAVLNIKSFPDELYSRLQERASEQRRSVAQEVIGLLERAIDAPASRSILELQGLGKKIWNEVDPAEYLEAERKSWD